jgi:hypothetical protein
VFDLWVIDLFPAEDRTDFIHSETFLAVRIPFLIKQTQETGSIASVLANANINTKLIMFITHNKSVSPLHPSNGGPQIITIGKANTLYRICERCGTKEYRLKKIVRKVKEQSDSKVCIFILNFFQYHAIST